MTVDEFVLHVRNQYPQYNPQTMSDEAVYNLGKKLEPNSNVDAFSNKTLKPKPIYTEYPNPNAYKATDTSVKTFDDHIAYFDKISRAGGINMEPYLPEGQGKDVKWDPFEGYGPQTTQEAKDLIAGGTGVGEMMSLTGSLKPTTSGLPAPTLAKKYATAWGIDADWWTDENSHYIMKKATNESVGGLAYEMMYGESKFNVDDYDPALWEEALGHLVSFVMPLDLMTLFIGGPVGKIGAKALVKPAVQAAKTVGKKTVLKSTTKSYLAKGLETRFLLQKGNRKLVEKFTPKFAKQFSDHIADVAMAGSIRSGVQYGTYEGVKGYMRGINQGLTGDDLWKHTWDSFSHSLVMGGLAGYGGGFLGAKWERVGSHLRGKIAKGTKLTNGEVKLLSKADATLRRNAVKFGYELGVFTSPTVISEWEGLLKGQRESWSTLWRDLVMNTMMVGAFKGVGLLQESAGKRIKTFKESQRRYLARRSDTEKSLNAVREKLEAAKEGAEGMDKAAYEEALNTIEVERKKEVKNFEEINKAIEVLERELMESSEKVKNLPEIKKDVGYAVIEYFDYNTGTFGHKKATAEQTIKTMETFYKALKSLNEYIGLTGDKEMAMRVNKFSDGVLNTIAPKVGSIVKNKPQLIALYKRIKIKKGAQANVILVERDGRPVKMHLIKDAERITAHDIIKAIESEGKALNRGAAENSIKDIEMNNRTEEYSKTEDFTRGYHLDSKGDPVVPDYLRNTNQRGSRNKNTFYKQEGRSSEIDGRAKELEFIHDKVSRDSGGENISYSSRESYTQSKSIILNAIETFFLNKLDKTGRNYKSIYEINASVEKIHKFSKWLAAEKKKNLYEVHNTDIMEYLREKGNAKDAKVLHEFYEGKKSRVSEFSTEKAPLNTELFDAYAVLRPKPKTTQFESDSRVLEDRLKNKFDFSDSQVRDYRESITGIRRHKDMSLSQQMKFNKNLIRLLDKPYEGISNQIRGSEMRIKLRAAEANIGPKEIQRTLEAFGVKDGKFKNVRNVDTLKQVENFMSKGLSRDLKTTIFDTVYFLEKEPIFLNNTGRFPGATKRFLSFMPSWYLIREKVSKVIYNALVSSEHVQERVMGLGFEYQVKISEVLKKSKDRDMLKFIDKDRHKEATTQKEKQFIEELEMSGDIVVDGKRVSIKEGQGMPADAIFEGGSKPWRASMLHRQYFDNIYRMQLEAIEYSSKNKADFLMKKKRLDKKYLTNYLTRVLNPEVSNHLYKRNGSPEPWFLEHVQKLLNAEAEATASKRGFKKGSPQYKEFVKKYKTQEKLEQVRDQASEMLYYDIHRINPNVLKKRTGLVGDSQGNVIVEGAFGKKKKIKAYISKYDAILDHYTRSMSKSIGATMYFPEFTRLGAGKKGPITTRRMKDLFNRGAGGEYALGIIKKHLGLNESMTPSLSKTGIKFGRGVGNFVVSAGLSGFAWHGIKNFGIGQARNVAAYGLMNTTWGLLGVFSRANWELARREGHLTAGIRSLKLSSDKTTLQNYLSNIPVLKHMTMKNLFRYWNLMEPSEMINRVSSGIAGRLHFDQMIRTYKGQTTFMLDGGYSQKMEIIRQFKDRLKLSETEIKHIDKLTLEELMNSDRYVAIESKVAQQSHIGTQGGTSPGMLPAWMSAPLAKPFTVFYRIAAHQTFDTYINYIKPIKTHGNPYPIAKLLLSHAASGMGLYWATKNLFGKTNPFDWVDWSKLDKDDKLTMSVNEAVMNINISGFFGVWDFLAHPTKGVFSNAEDIIDVKAGIDSMGEGGPALFDMSLNAAGNAYDIFFKRPKNMSQADWTLNRVGNFFKESTSFGSMYEKQIDRLYRPFMRDRKKVMPAFYSYLDMIGKGKNKVFNGGETKELTVMMHDLKLTVTAPDATYEGNVKAIMTVYNAIVLDQMNNGIHGLDAHKKAKEKMTSSLNWLKPIHKNMGKNVTDADILNFYETLTPEYKKMLYKHDGVARDVIKVVKAILGDRKVFNKYSILGGVGNMENVEYSPINKIYQKNFYESLDQEDKDLYDKYKILY